MCVLSNTNYLLIRKFVIVKEYKPKTTKNDLRYFKLFTINNSQYIFNEKNMYTIFGLEKVYYDNIFIVNYGTIFDSRRFSK